MEEWEAEVALVVMAKVVVMAIGLMEALGKVEESGEAGALVEITTHGELPKGAAERGEERAEERGGVRGEGRGEEQGDETMMAEALEFVMEALREEGWEREVALVVMASVLAMSLVEESEEVEEVALVGTTECGEMLRGAAEGKEV